MKQFFSVLGALALGATAMYYFDPEQGRRRRALVGDRVDSMSHDARDYLDSRRKRTTDRVRGMFARIRGRLFNAEPNDQQLHGQVRSRLGRAVSYPHAIETEVLQGRVVLKGDILEREYNNLMAEIWAIPRVKAIDSQLAQHAEPGNVPGLQGKPHRQVRPRVLARNTADTLAIAGGIGAGLKAMRVQGLAHTGMLSLAIALFAYGVGDGTQRLVRQRRQQRRARLGRQEMHRPAEAAASHEETRSGESTPALLTPTQAWH